MNQLYDNGDRPDCLKDMFKVVGLCLLGWMIIVLLLFMLKL